MYRVTMLASSAYNLAFDWTRTTLSLLTRLLLDMIVMEGISMRAGLCL